MESRSRRYPISSARGDGGEALVRFIVEEKMHWLWSGTDGKYPALDGLIEVCKEGDGNRVTGHFLGVEVKRGDSALARKSDAHHHWVDHDPDERWQSLPFPVLVVWVDEKATAAYWREVRRTDDGGPIAIPRSNRLTRNSMGSLMRLAARHAQVAGFPIASLPLVEWPTTNTIPALTKKSLKAEARAFYRDWQTTGSRSPSYRADVAVTRRGWDHLVRPSLPGYAVAWRLLLLPVARAIIESDTPNHRLRTVVTRSGHRRLYRQFALVNVPGFGMTVVAVITEIEGSTHRFRSVHSHHVPLGAAP